MTDEEREALNRGIDALCGVEDVSDGACRRDDAAARTLEGYLIGHSLSAIAPLDAVTMEATLTDEEREAVERMR